MTKSRGILPRRRYFTEIERELVRLNYADVHTAALAHVLDRSVHAIHRLAFQLGLRKSRETIAAMSRECSSDPDHGGRATRFQKGQVPPNKGKRMPGWAPGRMGATQFRKGHRSWNTLPIGTYRIGRGGDLQRKVTDLPGPPNVRWHAVSRIVWEAAHGPVPAGHVVVFKPGRRTTVLEEITLDRLELLTRAQLLARNGIYNLPPELIEVIRLRGTLNRSINRRRKTA